MTKADIIDKVLNKMDELTPFSSGLVSDDVNPVASYIDDSLLPAWRSLIIRCPVSLIPYTKVTQTSGIEINEDLSVSFTYKFIRVLGFKMLSWKKEVKEFITPDTQKYQEQQNQFTKGSIYKPIVAWVSEDSLIAFSANDINDKLDYCKIVPELTLENDVFIPDSLQEAFYYEVAGHVYAIMEQKQAEAMFALADKLIGL